MIGLKPERMALSMKIQAKGMYEQQLEKRACPGAVYGGIRSQAAPNAKPDHEDISNADVSDVAKLAASCLVFVVVAIPGYRSMSDNVNRGGVSRVKMADGKLEVSRKLFSNRLNLSGGWLFAIARSKAQLIWKKMRGGKVKS